MASNPTKWSRKRSIDEMEETPSPDSERSKKPWKVKTLDEILAEKEKRRKLDQDSFVDDENSRHSRKSSATSSPALVVDSKPSSQSHTPTQEIIYQLSPDHNSPLSSSSETSRKKSLHLKQKGRRKTDEEEGEILSDISDGESGRSKPRVRVGSRHTNTDHDIEMVEKNSSRVEASTKEQEESSEEESSGEDDSDDSSEEEKQQDNQPTEKQQKSSEEDEESTDSSDEESEESSEEEEEEEAVQKSKVEVEEKKNLEVKEAKAAEESSEDESEDDSDEDSDSEDSEDSDSSEEEEEQKEAVPANVDTKQARKPDEADSVAKKSEKQSNTKAIDVPERSKHKSHSSRDDPSRHWKEDRSRVDERKSRNEQEGKGLDSRDRRERKLKEDSQRVSRKEKPSNDNSDHKHSRELRRTEKPDSSRTRDRYEKQERVDPKARRKDSKTPKEQPKTNKERESKSNSSKTSDKNKETSKTKDKSPSKLLTDEERLQFSTEVVEPDSDDSQESVHSEHDEELDVSQSKEEEKEESTAPQLPDYLPAIQGCRNVSEEFVWLNRIEEGTYGVVYRARDKRTNEIVALKRLKMEKEKEGFPITSLREINTLLKGQHPNIVTVREVVVGGNMDKIFIVMDYVEHDLKTLMEHMNNKFAIGEVKTLLVQLLRAVAHLHDNWILHRDLKTSNLLLSNKGILKVADFGLAREYGSPLKHYTPIVVTLWYRAPELLLGIKEYACPIDMWSVGCIFAELLTMKPLFPGKSEIDQINKIFKDLGTPSDKIWPGPPAYSELPHVKKMTFTEYPYNQLRNKFGTHLTDKGFDLLNKFLTYDPKRRITAEKGLEHDYFNESPFPVKPDMFPTWPAKSEMMKRPKRRDYEHSPKPPEGGEMFSKLKDGGDSSSASGAQGFHMPSSKKGSAAVAGFSLKFNL